MAGNTSGNLRSALAAILLSLGLSWAVQGQPAADLSLVLHFDFAEDFSGGRVLDVSGNGNDGWQFNPTNWITATNGVFGSTAAQFTYVGIISNDPPRVHKFSQYIGITNFTGFAFLTNATMSAWAQFSSNTDNVMVLLDTGYDNRYVNPSLASNSWAWGRDSAPFLSFGAYPAAGGYLQLVRWPSDTIAPGGFSPNFATTAFHLYTVTIDCPGNQVVAYYDGQPYQTNSIGLPWLRIYGCPSIPWLCVGALSHNGTPQWGDDAYPNAGFFVGRLDDLRIYNRTLSSIEVQALYDRFVGQLAIQLTNSGSVQVTWSTVTGVQYQVESAASLATQVWAPVGALISGDGNSQGIVDSILGQPSRFYRVRVNP